MGVFPRRNAKVTMKLFNPIAKYLSRKLGREVELVISKDFESFWEGVTEQRYDLVHYNQYHYLESHKKYGYQVIAKNEEFGSSRISGVITIRVDSGIRSVLDLKGKKIVFGGGPKAMMSYIVPTYLLREGGLRAGDYEEAFARNPPNAILSAYFRQSAAAGAGNIGVKLDVVTRQADVTQLSHLVTSEPLAHLPWAASGRLDEDLRQKIKAALIDLKNNGEGLELLKGAKLTGISPATDKDYDPHRKIVKAVYGKNY
ncbi:MAG: PhnD/SsuA/transferrin family substrate-binding protein [Gammaproteobacteria bacterium]|jgi:phosphonate transport system substrate-binding protein